jgi:organic hydroperoxide reductase OsmC/OhrA
MAVVKAILAPKVEFSGELHPNADEYATLHARAHSGCFIANSVKTVVELKL